MNRSNLIFLRFFPPNGKLSVQEAFTLSLRTTMQSKLASGFLVFFFQWKLNRKLRSM